MTAPFNPRLNFDPSWLEPPVPCDDVRQVMSAHAAAIDHLCMNLLVGRPSLAGVAETYDQTLRVERGLSVISDGEG